jgi:histone-binding protein RBBP4
MSAETEETILEEYAIWRKNTPFLYDLVVTKPLEWPSLTCQWLPEKRELPNSDYYLEKLVLGTQTDGNAQNYLLLAQVKLPNERAEVDGSAYNNKENGNYGGFGMGQHGKIEIVQRIKHDGDVNRARYMPQNPQVIATKTVSGEVHIFDVSKHPLKPPASNIASPQVRLRGPQKEGFGLCWSPVQEGRIISAGEDRRIFLWDILGGDKEEYINPLNVYGGHADVVGDVSFHPHYNYMFGSVGDDKKIMLWDTRSSDIEHPSQQVEAHKDVINCVAFNPFSEHVLITGSSDTTLCLWDLRSLNQSLHVFESHPGEILQALWSPFHETLFASCGKDRQVRIWDLSRIGEEQEPEDAEDGPPELLFVHGGHTSTVQELSWNPNEPFMIASVADDNILQIWSMAQHIYEDTDDENMEPKDEDLE